MTSRRRFPVVDPKDYDRLTILTHDLLEPQWRDPHSHSRALLSARIAGVVTAPQSSGASASRTTPRPEPHRNRCTPRPFAAPSGDIHGSRGYGFVRPSQCAVSPPIRHQMGVRVFPTAPGRGCDNPLRGAVSPAARHESGAKGGPGMTCVHARSTAQHNASVGTHDRHGDSGGMAHARRAVPSCPE